MVVGNTTLLITMEGTGERTNPWDRIDGAGTPDPSGGDDGATSPEASVDPREAIDIVARRFDFLMAMVDGPVHRPVLQEELDISRSTAYKGIRELEGLRLVERTDRGYRLSLLGTLLLDQYDQFRTNVDAVCTKGPLLSELAADCDLDVAVLRGAEVIYAERHAPHHPLRALEAMLEEADTLYGMTPVVLPSYIEMFHERLTVDELVADLVMTRPVVEWLVTHQREAFEDVLRTGNLVARRTEEWLPFGLVFSDDPTTQVGVLVYDSKGDLRGFVVNDTEDALEWAERTWDQYHADSSVVSMEVVREP
ncbi:helix-turn-helix transcriptional regulator [Halomarina litorea]|uniref:helix-turn-helix transcriptional regulator n=1 Tax=Halomarina litorea TaxID=2961595 RepID=UPI0020C49A51|nr:hypothetical protein [Halomarina sp. BCD28]